MLDTELFAADEWDAAVANFDDAFHNTRVEDGRYVADFYVYADVYTDNLADELSNGSLRQSLEEALHAHDLLKPVFVTTDADEGWNLLFFNLHFPVDSQAKARLELAAEVVLEWRRKMGDSLLD